jgi:hypothetical protein
MLPAQAWQALGASAYGRKMVLRRLSHDGGSGWGHPLAGKESVG